MVFGRKKKTTTRQRDEPIRYTGDGKPLYREDLEKSAQQRDEEDRICRETIEEAVGQTDAIRLDSHQDGVNPVNYNNEGKPILS